MIYVSLERKVMLMFYLVLVGGFVEIYFGNVIVWDTVETMLEETSILSPGYLINTTGCRIPEYNPFSSSIKYNYGDHNKYTCRQGTTYTTQDGAFLKIDHKLKSYSDFSHCVYQGIKRDSNSEHKIVYKEEVVFKNDIEVHEEQVRVTCYNTNRQQVYRNFHAFTLPNLKTIKKLDRNLLNHKKTNNPKEVLNVWMIGIDSMSRFNHIRNMPKTRSLLRNNLSSFDLQGYTKVADNTFVNIIPLLAGHFVNEELARLNLNASKQNVMDDFNLIWKNFSKAGYSTLYGEDHPVIGAFTYAMGGFLKYPTDHYLRPITIAMEEESAIWNSYHNCIHNRSETSMILQYGLDFFKTYTNRPRFAFNFLTRLTHDEASTYAYTADDYYYDYLTKAQKTGVLNNTVLFVFGDHGTRFGPIMKKFIGKFEERVPLMNIVFPPWFVQIYPEIMNNLRMNTKRLTSNFDIFETLKSILYFTGKTKGNIDTSKQRGVSLFEVISETRTCKQAGISAHWCVCRYEEDVLTKDKKVRDQSAKYVVNVLNKKLAGYKMCSQVELGEIKTFTAYKLGERSTTDKLNVTSPPVSNKDNLYVLKMSVVFKPGSADFDITLYYDKDKKEFSSNDDFSRTNKYGRNGDCVAGAAVQSFCYCKRNSFFS